MFLGLSWHAMHDVHLQCMVVQALYIVEIMMMMIRIMRMMMKKSPTICLDIGAKPISSLLESAHAVWAVAKAFKYFKCVYT